MMARVAIRAAVLAAAAGGVCAAFLATPITPSTPQPATVAIAPPAPVVACPGHQRVPVGDVGTGGDLASEPTQRTFEVFAPVTTSAEGEGFVAETPVAGQMERIADGDIEGWSAVTCGQAKLDQWLVGGATSLGSSARLVLANPSGAPSEATVTVYGPLGEVQNKTTIAVAPGAQADKLLEAIAAELPAMVVRVQATGPGVVAALQDSRLEGFQPAGTEWVAPSPVAETLVIPAVGATDPNATVTLRLMSPKGASVNLSIVSDTGIEQWSVGQGFLLEPGVVTDIEVPQDLVGAIEVRASGQVVAAARTVVPRDPRIAMPGDVAYDHMWVSGQEVVDDTLTGVMPLVGARVAVYSATNGHVSFVDTGGATVAEADVAARTVQWVDVPAPPGTILTTTGAFAWAFVMESDAGYLASSTPVSVGQSGVNANVVLAPYPPGA